MFDRYSHPELEKIWSDKNKYQLWTDIELAFLTQKTSVPVRDIRITDQDIQDIKDIETRTKHDVAAFVEWLEDKLHGCKQARFVHYGLTSSDIVDTAFSLMIKQANKILNLELDLLLHQFNHFIKKYDHTLIFGRTHGQIAEPMYLSKKFQSYYNVIAANKFPMDGYQGRLHGSVGDSKFNSKGDIFHTLYSLGLRESEVIDGQIIHRSYFAKFMNQWAMMATILEKIATDFRLLHQTEIKEMLEDKDWLVVGSSSMPHKNNPVAWENLCGIARLIRGYDHSVMDSIVVWNERDISHSSVERIAYSHASVLLGYMIKRFNNTLSSSRFDIDQNAFEDYESSQSKLHKLIDQGMGRIEAHMLVKSGVPNLKCKDLQ